MRGYVTGLALLLGMAGLTLAAGLHAEETRRLDVWPAKPPGEVGTIGPEQAKTKGETKTVTSLTNVTHPTITVYQPEVSKRQGVAIVVCPGGGYRNLAWDHEGEQVGRWLSGIGVTAAVLKYRVPRREGTPDSQPPIQALMDAQRTLSLVRTHAKEWGVDPSKVGVLGFSAGGHLGAWASTNADQRAYEAIDAVDEVSCRPDFAVLIYPGGVIKADTGEFATEIRVTSKTPPMFLAHATDDRVNAENSVQLYLKLKQAGVPTEMHLYAKGGHGFGIRPSPNPAATWPKRCEEWLVAQGILASVKERQASRTSK